MRSPLIPRKQALTRPRRQSRHDHGRPLHPRLHRRRPPLAPHAVDPRDHQTLHLHRDRLPRSRASSSPSSSVTDDGKQQLNIPETEVEDILVALILDDKIQGRIDQVAQRLELDRQCVPSPPPFPSLTPPQQSPRNPPLRLPGSLDFPTLFPPFRPATKIGDGGSAREGECGGDDGRDELGRPRVRGCLGLSSGCSCIFSWFSSFVRSVGARGYARRAVGLHCQVPSTTSSRAGRADGEGPIKVLYSTKRSYTRAKSCEKRRERRLFWLPSWDLRGCEDVDQRLYQPMRRKTRYSVDLRHPVSTRPAVGRERQLTR